MEKKTIRKVVLNFDGKNSIDISLPYEIEVYPGTQQFILMQVVVDLMTRVKDLEDKISNEKETA